MPAIAAVAGHLIAAPRPVICLDTCDILEVVQCLDWEKAGGNTPRAVAGIRPVRRLLGALTGDPDRAQLVITELVHREWQQNITAVQAKAEAFLAHVDAVADQIHRAAALAGTVLPGYAPFSASSLVADVVAVSTALLNVAPRLELEQAQLQRALDRVFKQQRPSHDGHVKDSINFEHYLELARQLRAGGFVEEIVFVSKNRKDYWDGAVPRIHPDLESQASDPAVRLQFFGSLDAALGFLRI